MTIRSPAPLHPCSPAPLLTSAAIQFENVSKRFILHHARPRSFQELVIGALWRSRSREELWALKDVSFEVERGEMVGIIGPNGSGKSTVLKLITRILEPTSGRVTVEGKVSALIELGAGFHPDLTGRENVYLNGSILGLSQQEMDARFKDIVAFAELERFVDMPLKIYSSGMYMRLGFAIAINVEPDILLIDEVLAVGDESFQKRCLAKIEEFKQQGKTMVFVSHALETVRKLCDQAIWLEEGEIQSRGNPDKVIYDYLDDLRRKEGVALDEKHRHLRYELEEQRLENRWGSGYVLMGENDEHCLDGGWHEVEDWPPKVRWTTKRASLLLMPDGSATRLSMIAWCPQPALTPQSGRVYVDGRVVGKFDLTDTNARTFSFRLPRPPNMDRAIKVVIEVERTLIPAEAGLSEDRRELGVAVQEIWTD